MSISVLQKISLFSGLNNKELEEILNSTTSKKYSINKAIISEKEDSGNSFYMISKGKVKITRESEDGTTIVLSVLSEGNFFGEMSLLDGSSRSANVVSMTNTEVLILSEKDFLNLVNNNTQISFNLIKVLCTRIRNLNTLMKRLFANEYFL